jgi:hypothetical protein
MGFSVEYTDKHLNRRVGLRTPRQDDALRFAARLRASGNVQSVRVWDQEAGRVLDDPPVR